MKASLCRLIWVPMYSALVGFVGAVGSTIVAGPEVGALRRAGRRPRDFAVHRLREFNSLF